jgi:hypothetical protein
MYWRHVFARIHYSSSSCPLASTSSSAESTGADSSPSSSLEAAFLAAGLRPLFLPPVGLLPAARFGGRPLPRLAPDGPLLGSATTGAGAAFANRPLLLGGAPPLLALTTCWEAFGGALGSFLGRPLPRLGPPLVCGSSAATSVSLIVCRVMSE